ncbi:hypothetical protein PIB30_004734 [Stylosanthes scabra]|uniref:Uncharacterized protein n=1 Tax=Stylosanthes scabra TaxID=79078 RepID=A0ABU6S384_9FABA|nr:hypothetical protein [Stylosanthes scabra]
MEQDLSLRLRDENEPESWRTDTSALEQQEEDDSESLTVRRSKSFGGRSKSKKKKKSQVLLEGYVDDLPRTKSLTDDDLDELKGCLDLGFGFSYDEIPELCNTLPALELCYSMSQKFTDHSSASASSDADSSPDSLSSSIANWRISSPGDHPEDVKARLKFWAQAVACTVKLCS